MVHSSPESNGACQTHPAARENMETWPLKDPGESLSKSSVKRPNLASGVLHAPISF